ncbi:MAG: UbiA-like protein EboC [Ginsengibacter sp.]
MKKIIGCLQLMRPANIVTSVADVLAGIAISGFLINADINSLPLTPIILLCISTIGLYGGGIVFNDVFDYELDKVERPERTIPKGILSLNEGTLLGIFLLAGGITVAFFHSSLSGLIAVAIAIAALVYNKFSKHNVVAGPLNMGLCRGLNLLLGISIVTSSVSEWWFLSIVPIVYIAAITMISRGEVHGSKKNILFLAVIFYLLIIATILYFSFLQEKLWFALPFVLAFAWMILTPLLKAIKNPIPQNIGKSVKAGVIGIILLNASWAAAFGIFALAIFIVLLLSLSLRLSKVFAVT